MPTIKHPCPYCARYIDRDVAACPFCGRPDPFAPRRCEKCRAPLTDPSWVACPKCGTAVPPVTVPGGGAATGGPTPVATAPAAPTPAAATCPTCGSAVQDGAVFCRVCGSKLA
jgi:predicted amidophosphoribosyltransferase